jgi:hypothetical protein
LNYKNCVASCFTLVSQLRGGFVMNRATALKKSALAVALTVGLGGPIGVAYGNTIIPVLDATTPVASVPFGGFQWTYHPSLAGDSEILSGPVPGASTPATAGALGSTFADYFTIYDFAGYTGINSTPAGWTLKTALLALYSRYHASG